MKKYLIDILDSELVDDETWVKVHLYTEEEVNDVTKRFRPKVFNIEIGILEALINHKINANVVTTFEIKINTENVSLKRMHMMSKLLEEMDEDEYDEE